MSLITLHIHADGCAEILSQLKLMEIRIMATIQDLKDTIDAEKLQVSARLTTLAAEIQALKDQIAAGGTITEAQLDEVKVAIENIWNPPEA